MEKPKSRYGEPFNQTDFVESDSGTLGRIDRYLNRITPDDMKPDGRWGAHLASMTDGEMEDFRGWYDDYLADLNGSLETQERVAEHARTFEAVLRARVRQGRLPGVYLEAYKDTGPPEVTVYSAFDEILHGSEGRYNARTNTMHITETTLNASGMRGTNLHERLHAISRSATYSLTEALTAHGEKILLTKKADTRVFDPKKNPNYTYPHLLRQMDALSNAGRWHVAAEDFMEAHAGREKSSWLADRLRDELTKSFGGVDPIIALDAAMDASHDMLKQEFPETPEHTIVEKAARYGELAVRVLGDRSRHVPHRITKAVCKGVSLRRKAENAVLFALPDKNRKFMKAEEQVTEHVYDSFIVDLDNGTVAGIDY